MQLKAAQLATFNIVNCDLTEYLTVIKHDRRYNDNITLMSKRYLNKNHVQAFVIDEIKRNTTTAANTG